MFAKAHVVSWLLCFSLACQLGQGTGGFDKDPNQTNPDSTTPGGNSNSNPNGPGGGSSQSVQSRFLGRVSESSKILSWSGSGVEAGFNGTGGTANFSTSGSATSVIGVSVDGGTLTKVEVTGATAVPFGPVSAGQHVVRFTKLNESELGSVIFQNISFSGSTKAASFSTPSRRIEFVGDSITVGYGIEGTAPCDNNARVENVTKAWGYLTAQALQADASFIAWSGHGILRNAVTAQGDPVLMPAIWQRQTASDTSTKYDFANAPQPDAVVVNLGTNDYTYLTYSGGTPTAGRALLDQTAFTAAYKNFVLQIRQAYPNALIVLATSPMLSDSYPKTTEKQWTSLGENIAAVIDAANDDKIVSLSIPTQDTTTTGCDGHPNVAEQQKMSSLLVALLKQKLSW